MTADVREPILPGKSAPVGGIVLVLAGLAVIGGGLWGGLAGEERTANALALVLLAVPFGGGMVAAGLLLRAEKGGLRLDRPSPDGPPRLAFRGAGERDALTLPAASVRALRLVPRDEVWGRVPTRNWSAELLRTDGCPVVLAESSDYEGVWTVARAVEHRLGVPLEEQGDWAPAPAGGAAAEGATVGTPGRPEGRRTVQVRRGGPLPGALVFLGVAGVVVGAVLMSQVEREPIFGFLFGPTLLFLGLAFLLAAASGALATDVISWDRGAVRRVSRLGPLSWGAKELTRDEPAYLRLHHRGLVGASLEWVGRERTLVLVGGVTRASRLGYAGLLALAADLSTALGGPEPLDKPGSAVIDSRA